MIASTVESCGCEWTTEDPKAPADECWVELGFYDDAPKQWIRPCELHARYGEHREMSGFDEGLCK